MRLGIISDIHANIFGLRAALSQLSDVDVMLCAGDLTGYYPFVNEVFEALEEKSVRAILGNHDAYLFEPRTERFNDILKQSISFTKKTIRKEHLNKLGGLKPFLRETIDGQKISMYHGSPWDPLHGYIYPDYGDFENFLPIDANLIILGHTHYPMIKTVGETLIINPGSCGQPRDGNPGASYATYDTTTRRGRIGHVAYDMDELITSVQKHHFDQSLVTILQRRRE